MKPKDYFIVFKSKYKNQATVYEQKPDSKKAMLVTHVREVQSDDQIVMTALIKKTEQRVWSDAVEYCRANFDEYFPSSRELEDEGRRKGYLK